MNKDTAKQGAGSTRRPAEFDLLADEYRELHKANNAITDESMKYFAEFKILALAELLQRLNVPTAKRLNFGCGIENLLPCFREYFSYSEISYAEVSTRSIAVALRPLERHLGWLALGAQYRIQV